MPPLIVATQNPGKLKEMQQHLADLPWELQLMPPDLEIEETGTTFRENAILKATQVAKHLGQWAIADDSGLEVMALDGAPGLYSARYGKTDIDRIQRLLTELQGKTDRSAQFVCVIALARPDGSVACQAKGVCPGEILQAPQGEGGFGYDPIFYVPSQQQTFAELSATAKRQISHRGEAIKVLMPQLLALET
ncbi:RdgB/HAM1 family non-canonical purine NTP pyrophosphatase [Acaryochloris marina]|uniref:dITP/XTP pyrophosphatase n=1 Tax=Acaryochloris marina (strain MBIC 11017) TaxID=329726 RepID=B0C0F3_ACAM1|nr:RdgB/HAM1 family non-canonical purine NTP pyrophosphatase [Acaryochloris marina]ABW29645.1 non-canonical purine NTP pyrophosphatase, RdgB/HAM1 family [Acaryochloris marina MBIC11017]BDM78546.1 non-canonical purine NTP pyrophosphatase [Acaryochloris marina MBIC10699]